MGIHLPVKIGHSNTVYLRCSAPYSTGKF